MKKIKILRTVAYLFANDSLPMSVEGIKEFFVCHLLNFVSAHQHNIQTTQFLLMTSKTFTYYAFNPISINGIFQYSFTNRHSEPRIFKRVRTSKQSPSII